MTNQIQKLSIAILLLVSMQIFSQVGIGTQNPSSKSILDLTATDKGFLLPRVTTAQRTAIAPNNTTDRGMQVFDTNTLSIWFWNGTAWVQNGAKNIYDSNGDIAPTTATNRTVSFTNGGSLNFDSNTMVIDATNNRIGITRANPTQQFQLGNSGNVTDNKTYTGASDDGFSFNHYINTSGQNGNTFSRVADIVVASSTSSTAGAGVLRFLTSTNAEQGGTITEKMRIHTNGNVGIGTTSPTNKLHVNGNAKFTPSTNNDGTGEPVTIEIYGKVPTGNATQVGGIKMGWYNTFGGIEVLRGFSTLGVGLGFNVASELDGVTSEAMRITNNGIVGIGTQSPSSKSILDLTATDKGFLLPRMTTAQRTAIAPNNTTDRGMQVYDTNTLSIWIWNGTAWVQNGAKNIYDSNGDIAPTTATNRTVSFTNGGSLNFDSNTMVIDATNNRIGIGTSSPQNFIDIARLNGGITLRAGNSGQDFTTNQMEFGYQGTTNYSHIIKTRHNDAGINNNAFDFYVYKFPDLPTVKGGKHVMTIEGRGVGIGTTSPTQQLHLGNTGFVTANKTYTGTTDDGFSFNHYVNTSGENGNTFSRVADIVVASSTTTTAGAGVLRFLTSTNAEQGGTISEKMRIHTNGNVGIGSSDAPFKLSIVDNVSGNPARVFLKNTSATANSNADFLAQNDANSNFLFGIQSSTSTAGNITTGLAGTASFIKTTAGPIFVGAGVTTTGVRLDVGTTAWTSQSDRRTKKNIEKLENGLSKLATLSGYTYNYIKDEENTPRRVGLMAQEVKEVLPEAVSEDISGILGIKYTEVTPLIIEAVKDLKNELDAKNKELIQQKSIIDSLIKEVEAIKSKLK